MAQPSSARCFTGSRLAASWWAALSEVEKASPTHVSHLITAGEAILCDERLAWQSTAAGAPKRLKADGEGDKEGGAGGGEDGDGDDNTETRGQGGGS